MGTNYYIEGKPPCPHCGRGYEDERIHIGKSSAGWVFALHAHPELGINGLNDWKRFWTEKEKKIFDEYGRQITPAEMLDIITNRRRDRGPDMDESFYRENHAEPGPNRLARSKIDGRHTIAHGEGTWDICIGEYS